MSRPIPGYDLGMPSGFAAIMRHRPSQPSPASARLVFPFLPFACFLLVASCTSPAFIRDDIQSENPADRVLAIRAAGEARDAKSVPLLVDRLEDEDRAVRLYAILALEKITGQRFGYDYAKPDADQREAIERWRAHVRGGGVGVADGETGTGRAARGSAAGLME